MREAALLAGLPRAPSNYSPFDRAEAAKRRREVVLRRMVDFGVLKDEEAKRLAKTDLGLIPAGAAADDRSVLPRLRAADARGEVRRRHGPQGRTQRLHDPESDHAARRRAVAARRPQGARSRRSAKAAPVSSRGRHRHDRAPDRLRAGHGRRLRLLPQRVQSGRAGQAPARLGVQALHVHGRAGGRLHPRLADRGLPRFPTRSGPSQPVWKPENYDRKFRGSTTLQQAHRGVRQRRHREAAGADRARTSTIQVARRLGVRARWTSTCAWRSAPRISRSWS